MLNDISGEFAKIRQLVEKKKMFPTDLVLSKKFYDEIHEIGYENIKICEEIIDIASNTLRELKKVSEVFSDENDNESSGFSLISTTCTKLIKDQESEITTILDLLIGMDHSIKHWKKIIKNNPGCQISVDVDPSIFDIDVII